VAHESDNCGSRAAVIGLGFLAILGLAGCAGFSAPVKVNAFHHPDFSPAKSYTIGPKPAGVSASDAGFVAVANAVRDQVNRQGGHEARNPAEADVLIEIDYGVRAIRDEVGAMRELSTPGRIQVVPIAGAPHSGPQFARIDRRVSRVTTTKVVEKTLVIVARDNAATREPGSAAIEFWRIEVVAADKSDDLSACLPAMIRAAVDHIDRPVLPNTAVRVPRSS
jgi:hypothetical protein